MALACNSFLFYHYFLPLFLWLKSHSFFCFLEFFEYVKHKKIEASETLKCRLLAWTSEIHLHVSQKPQEGSKSLQTEE